MNIYRQLAEKVKELSVFCLEHRGRCFSDFSPAIVFRYVAFCLLNGSLFVHRDELGTVRMVVFAWRDHAKAILERDDAGEPQFTWTPPTTAGDAIMVGDVVGSRRWMPQIFSQVMAHWPDSPRLRLFAYRAPLGGRPRLTELNWQHVKRFTYGIIPKHT